MNTSPVNLRNLEQINEAPSGSSHRLATFLLAATGTAAVLVVALSLRERQPAEASVKKDPLAALVAQAAQEKKTEVNELSAEDLDFPDILSDADSRTTALVAVKDREGRLVPASPENSTESSVNPQQLPQVPLPIGTELAATSVTRQPKDELIQLAAQASKIPDDQPPAELGAEGGFLVQVASFKDQDDAEEFVLELRKRGHKAFRQAANVPGRGIWHRVRIGSFKTKYEADLYKKTFEEKERTIALVIDPDKVERARKVRAAKLAERIRNYGSD